MRLSSAPLPAWYWPFMTVGRHFRLSLLLPLAIACASDVPPQAPTAAAHEEAPRERWSRFDEIKSYEPVNATPFSTRGHLVKPSHAVVRVSPEAREQYLGLVTDSVLPDGAVIAMFHQSRDGATGGPVYVMEKKASAWTFVALDPDGAVTSENLNVCALCHRGGVADQLFGLPRSLRSTTGGTAPPSTTTGSGAR
jgi:hypothetical protein